MRSLLLLFALLLGGCFEHPSHTATVSSPVASVEEDAGDAAQADYNNLRTMAQEARGEFVQTTTDALATSCLSPAKLSELQRYSLNEAQHFVSTSFGPKVGAGLDADSWSLIIANLSSHTCASEAPHLACSAPDSYILLVYADFATIQGSVLHLPETDTLTESRWTTAVYSQLLALCDKQAPGLDKFLLDMKEGK